MNQVPMGVAPTVTPEVDEDGFSIQPRKNASWEEGRDKTSFYSDSDSDSDCEKPERKIHVEIKPLNNGSAPISASVDELRATVASLSPIGIYTVSLQHFLISTITEYDCTLFALRSNLIFLFNFFRLFLYVENANVFAAFLNHPMLLAADLEIILF